MIRGNIDFQLNYLLQNHSFRPKWLAEEQLKLVVVVAQLVKNPYWHQRFVVNRKGTKEAGNGPSLNKQLFATVDPYAFLTRALRQFLVYCVDQLQILG